MNDADRKLVHAAKITFLGTAFVGLGALASAYIPAIQRPVQGLDRRLKKLNDTAAGLPVAGYVFKHNPLTNNDTIRNFLAVSLMETALASGVVVGGGALLKMAGVTPSHVEKLMGTRNESQRGR